MLAPGRVVATPLRHELGFAAEGVAWFGSAYADALQAFDRDPVPIGPALSVRYVRPLGSWALLGVRGGWAWRHASVDVGAASTRNPVGPVGMHLGDAGAVLRLMTLSSSAGQRPLRVQLDLEAGVVVGAVTSLGVSQAVVAPRFALSVLLGQPLRSDVGYLGLRVGAQYVPWDGAGGSATDPAFAGFLFGVEGGFAP
jgi:hypothetical protein